MINTLLETYVKGLNLLTSEMGVERYYLEYNEGGTSLKQVAQGGNRLVLSSDAEAKLLERIMSYSLGLCRTGFDVFPMLDAYFIGRNDEKATK